MKIAIFPGSFAPFHEGHLMIVKKALSVFDKVIIVVTNNENKRYSLSLTERKNYVIAKVKNLSNVDVMINENYLTVEFAKNMNVKFLIRGLRNNKDFNFESQLHHINKKLNPEIETIFFMTDNNQSKITSSIINKNNKRII